MSSNLERAFETRWRQLGGPDLESEYRFHPKRLWRFDFALPDSFVAIEVEGGVGSGGRHTRLVGFTNDCEKYNEAALLGWRVYRFTTLMINKDPYKYIKPIVEAVV